MGFGRDAMILSVAITLLGCGARGQSPIPLDPDTGATPADDVADAAVTYAAAPAAPSTDAGARHDARPRFRSEALGIAFHPGVFSANERTVYVELDGKFWVDEPHGLVEPGQDSKQYFRGRISIVKKDVRACVRDHHPHLEGVLWSNDRFVPSEGLTEDRVIAGRGGFVLLWGAHGYDYRDYYVSIGEDRTLVARFSVVGDYVQMRKKGPPEEEQVRALEAVVASIVLLR
jgi:hypothetical protein